MLLMVLNLQLWDRCAGYGWWGGSWREKAEGIFRSTAGTINFILGNMVVGWQTDTDMHLVSVAYIFRHRHWVLLWCMSLGYQFIKELGSHKASKMDGCLVLRLCHLTLCYIFYIYIGLSVLNTLLSRCHDSHLYRAECKLMLLFQRLCIPS